MTRPPRRIDHLVLAVHDLEDAADFYTRMGFQVGARNRHPWGTEHRLIQFRSSFLELITVADAEQVPPHAYGFFSFGAFVEDYLTKREGLAMFALRHPNRANLTAAVTLDVESPDDHVGFLRAFTGAPPSEDGRHYPLGNGGQLAIQTRSVAPGFTGFSIGIADLDLVAQRLTAGHVPFQKHPGHLSIDADHCFGTRIDFTTVTQH